MHGFSGADVGKCSMLLQPLLGTYTWLPVFCDSLYLVAALSLQALCRLLKCPLLPRPQAARLTKRTWFPSFCASLYLSSAVTAGKCSPAC